MSAIAEGLARSVSVKRKFANAKEDIERNLEPFFEKEIAPMLLESLKQCVEKLADKTLTRLFDDTIKPILVKFRSSGGTIGDLKKKIKSAVREQQAPIQEELRPIVIETVAPLSAFAREKLEKWLQKYEVTLPDGGNENYATSNQNFASDNLVDTGLVDTIAMAIGAVIGVIITTILLFSGPIGWIIGIIAGIAIGKGTAESIPLPSWLLGWVLDDGKIRETREQIGASINRRYTASLIGFTAKPFEIIESFKTIDATEKAELRKASEDCVYGKILISIETSIDKEIEKLNEFNLRWQ